MFSPNGAYCAFCHQENGWQLWYSKGAGFVHKLVSETKKIQKGSGSSSVVLVTNDGCLITENNKKWKRDGTRIDFGKESETIVDAKLSPCGKLLATLDNVHDLRVFDTDSTTCLVAHRFQAAQKILGFLKHNTAIAVRTKTTCCLWNFTKTPPFSTYCACKAPYCICWPTTTAIDDRYVLRSFKEYEYNCGVHDRITGVKLVGDSWTGKVECTVWRDYVTFASDCTTVVRSILHSDHAPSLHIYSPAAKVLRISQDGTLVAVEVGDNKNKRLVIRDTLWNTYLFLFGLYVAFPFLPPYVILLIHDWYRSIHCKIPIDIVEDWCHEKKVEWLLVVQKSIIRAKKGRE